MSAEEPAPPARSDPDGRGGIAAQGRTLECVQALPEELVREAARRLGEAARKPARVILFGSYARGEADATSDLDFLVVQKDGFSRRREIVRLQDVLSPLRVPAEVLVIDHDEAERPERAGDAVREALSSGVVLYESA